MNNQLIIFEKDRVDLPQGFRWKVYSVFSPSSVLTKALVPFEHYDICIHMGKVDEGFHLFHLKSGENLVVAYCQIVKLK